MRRIIIASLLLGLFLPSLVFGASEFKKWNWNGKADNYHVNDPKISANGKRISVMGGSGVTATDHLLYFKKNKNKPVWKFNPSGALFDNEISKTGKYVVACGSKVWLFNNEKNIAKTKNKHKRATRRLKWSADFGSEVFDTCDITPNGKYLVAGSRYDNIYLFKKNSSTPIMEWKSGAEYADGINDIAISNDGRYVVAATDTSVLMLDRKQDAKLWEYTGVDSDVHSVDITEDGQYAIATEYEKVYLFNKDNNEAVISKEFESFHPLEANITGNGKYIYVTTNDKYYAYARSDAFDNSLWEVTLDERQTNLNTSTNGKYIAVSSGYDYAFIFDRDYPETENRPFQYYTGIFVGAVGLDGQGKNLAYESTELKYRAVKPGVLADLQDDSHVYGSGSEMNLRLFMTNPGEARNAKVKVDMKLPQLGWWEDFGGDYENEPDGIINKAVAKVGKTIGAENTLFTKTYSLKKNKSKIKNLELEMPSLQDSGFWSGLLDTLGISDLLESIFDALDNILPDVITNAMRITVDGAISGNPLSYPMIGYGEVTIYNPDTNEIFSRDSFMFIYLL